MKGAASRPAAVSLLVPVVERHDDLRELHQAVLPELEKLGARYEILYLVSAEFDRAFQQARELHERDGERVRVLRFARPVSEAAALATGFARARGELLLTLPAYFDADPAGLVALHRALGEGADLAFASRTQRSDGVLKRIQAGGFNRLTAWLTGTRFRDVASGTRALRREVVDELPLYGDFHRFLPVLAHRIGFAVWEVPVRQDARASAPALYRPRTYLWRALDLLSMFFLSHFTRRPLRLFGAVGSLFGGAGALILLTLGIERLLGQAIAGRPILILGTLLLGLGVQSFTIGLLGELLLYFQARDVRDYRVAQIFECADPPLPLREREG
jgi:glycosyltransferase involved in cell wall biosynthesis